MPQNENHTAPKNIVALQQSDSGLAKVHRPEHQKYRLRRNASKSCEKLLSKKIALPEQALHYLLKKRRLQHPNEKICVEELS